MARLLARHECVSPVLSKSQNGARLIWRSYPSKIASGRRRNMRSGCLRFLFVLAFSISWPAWGQKAGPQHVPKNGGDFSNNTHPMTKVPAGVILVKGAWSLASDLGTPRPEGGSVTNDVFSNQDLRR